MNKYYRVSAIFMLAVILISVIPAGCSAPAQQQPVQQQQTPTSPVIGVNPNQLSFTFKEGQTDTVTKQVAISNAGGGVMIWAASSSADWMWMDEPRGAIEKGYTKNLDLYVTPNGKAPGAYKENIVVEASGATNSPLTIPVVMNVTAKPVVVDTSTGAARKPTPPPPWEYQEYKNDTYDFIFRYPKTYSSKTLPIKGAVVGAVSGQGTNDSDIVMVILLGGLDYKSIADEWGKEAIRYMGGKPNLRTTADNKTTLGDGETEAYEIVYDSKSSATGAYQCYILGVHKKTRFIFFGAVAPQAAAADKMQIWKEMARTLEFVN